MNQDEVKRISGPDDPRRCNGVTGLGQCQQLAMDSAKYCSMHGGVMQVRKLERESSNNYRLAKYQDRLKEKANTNSVKSLRDEIGLLRMLIEERINSCNSATDLMVASPAIADMVVKVEKLVSSCHRIEDAMGQLLDKSALIQFADRVVQIVAENIADAKIMEQVAKAIAVAVEGKAVEAEYTIATPEQRNAEAAHMTSLLGLSDEDNE